MKIFIYGRLLCSKNPKVIAGAFQRLPTASLSSSDTSKAIVIGGTCGPSDRASCTVPGPIAQPFLALDPTQSLGSSK
jgi:hypothetical protein